MKVIVTLYTSSNSEDRWIYVRYLHFKVMDAIVYVLLLVNAIKYFTGIKPLCFSNKTCFIFVFLRFFCKRITLVLFFLKRDSNRNSM